MKLLKKLLIVLVALMLFVGIGIAALVYLVDWNDFKETIQNQTKKHTGRDLTITGDLSPSVFPWAGISIGEISLSNAEGFGDQPFAKISSADVKVKLLPLLRKQVNIRTVELNGLALDLQRAADGTSNWDDLVASTTTTTTTSTDDSEVEVEVEGGTAAIAALAVGGIDVSNANVSWYDAQAGTDAKLSNFSLNTGSIELAKPFDVKTKFDVSSLSMDMSAQIVGKGVASIDLENQVYSLNDFAIKTNAKGSSLPNGKIDATFGANINANMQSQQIIVDSLLLSAMGVDLKGRVDVTGLDKKPNIVATLNSGDFNPREVLTQLGMADLVTADPEVLKKASVVIDMEASTESASLKDLTIVLDDTTFSGEASVPSMAGGIPPLRFDFKVNEIDVDRYLPPVTDTPEEPVADAPAIDGDAPLGIPSELIRQLDVNGVFRVNKIKVSNLTTESIVVPLVARVGKVSVDGLKAALYEGSFTANASLDATLDTPRFAVDVNVDGIQADPMFADLLKGKSPLSGKGGFASTLTTSGDSINAIKAGLLGDFNMAFKDGSVNGVDLGYQIRRAQAALKGEKLAEGTGAVKTDFSALTVSGSFLNGVMKSTDLDMRSPLLRVGGAGTVDLPQSNIDYTMTTLITGTAEGQGGKDLEALAGVKLDVPIKATFEELAANPAGVILKGMRDNMAGNLKNTAKAKAEEAAAEALGVDKSEAKEAVKQKADEAKDKLKGKLEGLLK